MRLQKNKNENILQSILIDKHFFQTYMGKADPSHLLVYVALLYLAEEKKEFLYQDVAELIRSDVNGVKDGILYWVGEGVISISGDTVKICGKEPEKKPVKSDLPPVYSSKEIGRVLEGDKQLKALFDSAQKILGKMLSTSEINTLFSLYDWLGLPVSVICILIEYCAENNKRSMKYIERAAVSWADCGITTLDDAILYVSRERAQKNYINEVKKVLGIADRKLTALEQQNILKWQEMNMPPELVLHAYEITVNRTGKYAIAYMHKIILSWAQQDLRTLKQIKAKENEYIGNKKAPKSMPDKRKDSYDYDKIASEAAKRMLEKLKEKSE